MSTLLFTTTLVLEHCPKCGVPFGMEAGYKLERLNRRDTFYCPSGHPQHYIGKTEAEKAREEAERQRIRADGYEQLADERAVQRDHARRQAAASRGVVTRIKRRIGKGVCPCCNRTFADLGRHMAGQHPDFAAQEG